MKIKLIALLSLFITTSGIQAVVVYVKNNSKIHDDQGTLRAWVFFKPKFGCRWVCDEDSLTDWRRVNTCCSKSEWARQGQIQKIDTSGKGAVGTSSYNIIVRGRYTPPGSQAFETINLESKIEYGKRGTGKGVSASYPVEFPGYWVEEGSPAYASTPGTPRRFADKNYKFVELFKNYNEGLNTRRTSLADIALPPSGVYKTQAQLDQQAAVQQSDIPALLEAGSFGKITNQTAMPYQIKDSGLPPLDKNSTTNVPTQWPTTKQKFSDLADNSQTITFVPTDATSGFPSFTFTFNESAQTITISRSGESGSNITAATWIINFTPILNFAQQNLTIPGAKSWTLDFTINNDGNIIIDQLKVDFYRYKADAGTQTIKSEVFSYAFLPHTTTKFITEGEGVQPKSHPLNTSEQQISGGLCSTKTRILESTNPTCTATPIKK